eukprot:7357653-Pyramimonas_sp.AAC.1
MSFTLFPRTVPSIYDRDHKRSQEALPRALPLPRRNLDGIFSEEVPLPRLDGGTLRARPRLDGGADGGTLRARGQRVGRA